LIEVLAWLREVLIEEQSEVLDTGFRALGLPGVFRDGLQDEGEEALGRQTVRGARQIGFDGNAEPSVLLDDGGLELRHDRLLDLDDELVRSRLRTMVSAHDGNPFVQAVRGPAIGTNGLEGLWVARAFFTLRGFGQRRGGGPTNL
jgi:hypothetical protein